MAMLEQSAVIARRAGPLPRVQRVLVDFDGSPGAWAALRYGIAVAASRDAVLTIAAVVSDPPMWLGMPPLVLPWTRDALRRDAEHELQQALAAARDEVPATISASTALLHGRTARALADLADGGRYDLVITGRNRGGLVARWLGGGVASGLVSRCRTSVLAVDSGA